MTHTTQTTALYVGIDVSQNTLTFVNFSSAIGIRRLPCAWSAGGRHHRLVLDWLSCGL
jgi:hypothetical protein